MVSRLVDRIWDLFSQANRPFLGSRRRSELAKQAGRSKDDLTDFLVSSQRFDINDVRRLLAGWTPMEPHSGERDFANHLAASSGTIDIFALSQGESLADGNLIAYREVDEARIAFMFGDVSGHGPESQMLSAIVYGLFEYSWRDWSADPLREIPSFLHRANQVLLEGSFPGGFTAIQVGVVDGHLQKIFVGHAGCPEMRIVRPDHGLIEDIRLPDVPALGVFPTDFFSGIKYQAFDIEFDAGDMVLLLTDGLEYSTRECTSKLTSEEIEQLRGKRHPDEVLGAPVFQWDTGNEILHEQLGRERVTAVIQAICSRKPFTLFRYRDPQSPVFTFDFSEIDPEPRSVVLALAALETVFRVRSDGRATDHDVTCIEIEVAEFLRRVFPGYDQIFGRTVPHPGEDDDSLDPNRPSRFRCFHSVASDPSWADRVLLAIGHARDEPIAHSNGLSWHVRRAQLSVENGTPDYPPDPAAPSLDAMKAELEELSDRYGAAPAYELPSDLLPEDADNGELPELHGPTE